LLFMNIEVRTETGTIHNARASFTIVPTDRATAPYLRLRQPLN
jgi:hypothetical protein